MPFLLMIFLTLVCLPEVRDWPAPLGVESLAWSIGWTAAGVMGVALHARQSARRLVRGLAAGRLDREQVVSRYEHDHVRSQLLLLIVYVLSLVVFGWGWAVAEVWHGAQSGWNGAATPWPGTELVLLAPYFLAQLLCWAFAFDADRALHCGPRAGGEATAPEAPSPRRRATFESRASYLLFQARQKLALVFLPVLLLIAMKEARRLFPETWKQWEGAVNLIACVALLIVFVTLPWLVRVMLGLKPLPEGPLRDRLRASAKRLGFRYANLLLWNTRSGMANAMVIGVLPWVRYVVFTDRLLEEFSLEEVEAVFGHEVGHIKHRHMLYYLGFLLVSVVVLGSVAGLLEPYVHQWLSGDGTATDPGWLPSLVRALHLQDHGYLALLPMAALLLSYIFVVFGFLSRRCERQADIFGCRAVSCERPDCDGHDPDQPLPEAGRGLCPTGIRTFIRALEKVASVNGISRDRPGFLQSWQHSTIARRVDFLQRMLADPKLEKWFQRRVAVVKWALLLALGGAMALLIYGTGLHDADAAVPGQPTPVDR